MRKLYCRIFGHEYKFNSGDPKCIRCNKKLDKLTADYIKREQALRTYDGNLK